MKPCDSRRMWLLVPIVLVCVLGALAAGCSGSGPSSPGAGPLPGATPGGSPSTPGAPGSDSAAASQIPAGRSIAEGGGGPLTYTFREEWRRALGTAVAWRAGAYLVTAVGDQVNDDGVPSSWRFTFADKAAPDAVLLVDVDPWGKVTGRREVSGSGATGLVGSSTKPMPYAVIDSDAAVTAGKKSLGAAHDLAKTKDPRIGLNFSPTDGSGPYWVYTLFDESTADYLDARMDALTGEMVPAP